MQLKYFISSANYSQIISYSIHNINYIRYQGGLNDHTRGMSLSGTLVLIFMQFTGRSYEENKKKFWKEIKRIRKGGTKTEETVKDRNGRLLKGDDAGKRWAEHFENLLNVVEDREAEIVGVVGVQVPVMGVENESEITRGEVERALKETKTGKAPGVDGVTGEMLKEGGVTVVEWLVRLFNVCFYLPVCPVEWVLGVIVPLYKGKGNYIYA